MTVAVVGVFASEFLFANASSALARIVVAAATSAHSSAVSLFAVLDRENAQHRAVRAEEDAVIAEPEAKLVGVIALQFLHIPFATDHLALQPFKDSHRRAPVEGPNIRPRLLGPVDPEAHVT